MTWYHFTVVSFLQNRGKASQFTRAHGFAFVAGPPRRSETTVPNLSRQPGRGLPLAYARGFGFTLNLILPMARTGSPR
jgi:hypothetical protein